MTSTGPTEDRIVEIDVRLSELTTQARRKVRGMLVFEGAGLIFLALFMIWLWVLIHRVHVPLWFSIAGIGGFVGFTASWLRSLVALRSVSRLGKERALLVREQRTVFEQLTKH